MSNISRVLVSMVALCTVVVAFQNCAKTSAGGRALADGQLVSESNGEATPNPDLVPLVDLAVDQKYSNDNHVIYLFDNYSHCKYPRSINETGIVISDLEFDTILGHESGGVCNGSFPGSGAEPTDWIQDTTASDVLVAGTTYRYDGNNARFEGANLCDQEDNTLSFPDLVDLDMAMDTDPQKMIIHFLMVDLYEAGSPPCE